MKHAQGQIVVLLHALCCQKHWEGLPNCFWNMLIKWDIPMKIIPHTVDQQEELESKTFAYKLDPRREWEIVIVWTWIGWLVSPCLVYVHDSILWSSARWTGHSSPSRNWTKSDNLQLLFMSVWIFFMGILFMASCVGQLVFKLAKLQTIELLEAT